MHFGLVDRAFAEQRAGAPPDLDLDTHIDCMAAAVLGLAALGNSCWQHYYSQWGDTCPPVCWHKDFE